MKRIPWKRRLRVIKRRKVRRWFWERKKIKKAAGSGLLTGVLMRMSLVHRIVVPFAVMIVLSVGIVGVFGYTVGKQSTIKQVEGRLESEALKTINQLTTLNLLQDEAFLEQRLHYELTQQRAKLAQNDMTAHQFIVKEGEMQEIPRVTRELLALPEKTVDQMQEMERGVLHTEANGIPYTIGFEYSHEMAYIYAIAVKDADYMASIHRMRDRIVTAIMISVGVSLLIGWVTARGITQPIRKIRDVLKRMSDGKLDEPLSVPESSPEIRSLSESMETMRIRMSTMISEVKDAVDQLQGVSGHLRDSSRRSEDDSQQTAEAIRVVRNGADQTADSTDDTMAMFSEMKRRLEAFNGQMHQSGERSERMSADAKEGRWYLEHLIRKIQSYETEMMSVKTAMNQLQDQSVSIETVVTTIQDISEQTKLLALNASIEAARAGESGNGFAVVAQEIRKLADATRRSTDDIDRTIGRMQEQTTEAATQTDAVMKEIEKGQRSASEAESVFTEMIQGIDRTNGDIQTSLAGIEQIAQSAEQVEHTLATYSRIAQQTSESTEKMTEASEKQKKTAEQSNQWSEALMALSSGLQQKTDPFQVVRRTNDEKVSNDHLRKTA